MTDLVSFLRARLDEDEVRIVRLRELAAEDEAWREDGEPVTGWTGPDPLLEVEAKRRIYYEARPLINAAPGGLSDRVLRLLALPYAGHPDYDEAWRP